MTIELETLSEKEMDALERAVPDLARTATKTAYIRALSANKSVLRVESGDLVWVSVDGSKTLVSKAQSRRKVKVGQVVKVRRVKDQAVSGRA